MQEELQIGFRHAGQGPALKPRSADFRCWELNPTHGCVLAVGEAEWSTEPSIPCVLVSLP